MPSRPSWRKPRPPGACDRAEYPNSRRAVSGLPLHARMVARRLLRRRDPDRPGSRRIGAAPAYCCEPLTTEELMRVKEKPVPTVPVDFTPALDPRELVKRSRQLERSLQRRRRVARQLAMLDNEIRIQRRLLGDLMTPAAPPSDGAVLPG